MEAIRRILPVFCIFVAIGHCPLSRAALNEIIYLDVTPATSLDDALIDWGTKAHVTVMINTRMVQGRLAPEIHGQFPARAALTALLVNSGLEFKEDGDRVMIISQSSLRPSVSKDDSTGSHDDGHPPELQEVVVSAERREETIDHVPISMTALSQSSLNDLHVESLTDIANIAPGIVIPPGGAGSQSSTNIIIRGVVSENNAPTTGVYVDETPIIVRQMDVVGFSGTPQPDIFDLERLEVLRGPQGTLFGSGSMGGTIRFITPQPNLETASGYSKTEFSYTDRGAPSYAVGVAYGSPIVQGTAGFRVSVLYHSDGGFIDIEDPNTGQILNHNANTSHSLVLRPAFTIVPTDSLTITPAVFMQRLESDEPPEYWLNGLPTPTSSAYATGFGAHVHQTLHDNLTVSSLAIKYSTDEVNIESDTSYTDRYMRSFDDYSNILPAIFGAGSINPALANFYSYDEDIARTTAWQQEFRVSSRDSNARLTWLGGIYLRQALDVLTQYVTPDLTPVTEIAGNQTSDEFFGVPNYVQNGVSYNSFGISRALTEQEALFGELAFKILPSLKATVGLRYEHSAVTHQNVTLAGPLDGAPYTVTRLPDDGEHPLTPKYSLVYQYSDTGMVYGTIAKGYRTGGSNSPNTIDNPNCSTSTQLLGLSSVPATFKSDSLWSYEIGAKGLFSDKRLAVDASVFYIDWSNIQTSVYLPSCQQSFDTNRGHVVSQGFDVQMTALLTANLKATASVGYTDTYYPNALYGLTAPDGTPGPLLNGAGDKLTSVIPWGAAASLDYSTNIDPLWRGARAYARLDYRWLDAKPIQNPNVANYDPGVGPYPDEAYGIYNLRLGVISGGLDLSMFGDNLNRADPRLSLAHAVGDPLYYAVAVRPLTVGLTALYRF